MEALFYFLINSLGLNQPEHIKSFQTNFV